MNGYELSRKWFDWCFENPEKISPNHSALYFFAIEHCNRLGWREKFGFPTEMAKEAIGIRSYNTYIKTLNDLVDWGFIRMIERSKNQFSSNIIALSNFDKALDKALDKASVKHASKQSESTQQSTDSIIRHNTYNIEHNTDFIDVEVLEYSFSDFWSMYPNKTNKKKAEEKFNKLTKNQKEKIEQHLPYFINNKPFKEYTFPHATTYLNQERYNDEITINTNNNGITKLTDTEQFKLITEAIKSTGIKR